MFTSRESTDLQAKLLAVYKELCNFLADLASSGEGRQIKDCQIIPML